MKGQSLKFPIILLLLAAFLSGCSKPKRLESFPNAGNPPNALYAIFCGKCNKISYVTDDQLANKTVVCYFCKFKQPLSMALQLYDNYHKRLVGNEEFILEGEQRPETEEEKRAGQEEFYKTRQEQFQEEREQEKSQQQYNLMQQQIQMEKERESGRQKYKDSQRQTQMEMELQKMKESAGLPAEAIEIPPELRTPAQKWDISLPKASDLQPQASGLPRQLRFPEQKMLPPIEEQPIATPVPPLETGQFNTPALPMQSWQKDSLSVPQIPDFKELPAIKEQPLPTSPLQSREVVECNTDSKGNLVCRSKKILGY